MPYIHKDNRRAIDKKLKGLIEAIQRLSPGAQPGVMNYCLTKLIYGEERKLKNGDVFDDDEEEKE